MIGSIQEKTGESYLHLANGHTHGRPPLRMHETRLCTQVYAPVLRSDIIDVRGETVSSEPAFDGNKDERLGIFKVPEIEL